MDSRQVMNRILSTAPDILPLVIAGKADQSARWAFAASEKITSMILREVHRRTKNFHDREDLEAEARVGVVEEFDRGLPEFSDEGRVVTYWSLRIRRLVDQAIRQSGNAKYVKGRIIRPEVASGTPADMHRAIYAARTPSEALHAADPDGRSAEESARKAQRLELIRSFLSTYPDQRAVRAFLQKALGHDARSLMSALDLAPPSRSISAYQRVYSDLLAFLFAQGETPVVARLGVYVAPGKVAAVVERGGMIVESWTVRTRDYQGLRKMTRRVRASIDRGVARLAVNAGATDEGVLVRFTSWGRGVECDVVEMDHEDRPANDEAPRGAGGLSRNERLALALAIGRTDGSTGGS